MFSKTLGLVAASALAANAFLIPSTMSLAGENGGAVNALEASTASLWGDSPAYKGGKVRLECNGCSWPEKDGVKSQSEHDISSSLSFNFKLSPDSKTLLFDDQRFFTAEDLQLHSSTDQPRTLLISQSAPEISEVRQRTMSYVLSTSSVEADEGSSVSLVDLRMHINGLDNESVHLDNVGVRLLRDAEGNLRIMDVQALPNEDQAVGTVTILPIGDVLSNVQHEPQHCPVDRSPAAFLCRFRSFMRQRMESIRQRMHARKGRPCHGRKHGKQAQQAQQSQPAQPAEQAQEPQHAHWTIIRFWRLRTPETQSQQQGAAGAPVSQPPQHMHRGMHHRFCMRRAAEFLRRVVVGFIIPILIGIMAGVTVSVLGMAVGILLSFLFRTVRNVFTRSRRARNDSGLRHGTIVLVEDGNEDDAEKVVLLNSASEAENGQGSMEAPPAYADEEPHRH